MVKAAWYLEQADTLYIDASGGFCAKHNHLHCPMKMILAFADGKERVFTGCYCVTCKRQYITRNDYATLQREYGKPLVETDVLDSSGVLLSCIRQSEGIIRCYDHTEFPERAQQSILNKRGYNVGQKDNLSTYERQSILKSVITSGELSKGWICSYLNYMIKIPGKRENNWLAREKWQEDLEFVRNFDERKMCTQKRECQHRVLTRDDFLVLEDELPF